MIRICGGGCGRRRGRRGRRRSARGRRSDDARRSGRRRSGNARRRKSDVASARSVESGIARGERRANFVKSVARRNVGRRASPSCEEIWPRSTKKSLVAVCVRARVSGEWRCPRPRPWRRRAGSPRCRRRRVRERWRCRRRRPRRADACSNDRIESVGRESMTTADPEVEAEARVEAPAVAVLAVATLAVDRRRDAIVIDRATVAAVAVAVAAAAAVDLDVVDTRRASPIRARGRDRGNDAATTAMGDL